MTENTTIAANSNAIAIRWGIIIAVISCILFTAMNMFVIGNFIAYMGFGIVIFFVQMIMYGIAGTQQKKAMGGYMTFKEAFRTIFIAILISVTIMTIYSFIYTRFIDPGLADKISDSSLKFSEKMGVPQDKLDEIAKQSKEKAAEQAKLSSKFLGYLIQIIVYSIFGFIVAAIVKKNKPEPGPLV